MRIDTTEFRPNSFSVPLLADPNSPSWNEIVGRHEATQALAISGVSAVLAATEGWVVDVPLLGQSEDVKGPNLVSQDFKDAFSSRISHEAYALARNGIFVLGVARAVSDLLKRHGQPHGRSNYGALKHDAEISIMDTSREAVSSIFRDKDYHYHVSDLLVRTAYKPDLSYSGLNLAIALRPNGDLFAKVEAFIKEGRVSVDATSGIRIGHFGQPDRDRSMKPLDRFARAITTALADYPPETTAATDS